MGLQNTVPSYQSYNEEIHESCYPHLKNKNVPLNTFTCIDTNKHGYNRDIYKKVLVTFSLFLRSCFDTLFRAIYQNPNQCPCNNNKNNIYIYIYTYMLIQENQF